MKTITTSVLAALTLAVGAACAPGLVSYARAEEPAAGADPQKAQMEEEEMDKGIGEWKGIRLRPTGVRPKNIDADAAVMLARRNGCFRCHEIDRVKVGPAFNSVSDAYKNNLKVGEKREIAHLTEGDVFVLNGNVDHHRLLQTEPPGDPAQLRNLIYWIFSLDK
jgi:cytochrome c